MRTPRSYLALCCRSRRIKAISGACFKTPPSGTIRLCKASSRGCVSCAFPLATCPDTHTGNSILINFSTFLQITALHRIISDHCLPCSAGTSAGLVYIDWVWKLSAHSGLQRPVRPPGTPVGIILESQRTDQGSLPFLLFIAWVGEWAVGGGGGQRSCPRRME